MVSEGKITNSQIMNIKKKSIKNFIINIWENYNKKYKNFKNSFLNSNPNPNLTILHFIK
jgi:hypothetical protein